MPELLVQFEFLVEDGQVIAIDRDRQFTIPFIVRVYRVSSQRFPKTAHVFLPEVFERLKISWEDAFCIGKAVHDRCRHNPPRSPRRTVGNRLRFDQNDISLRICFFRLDSRPQTRESTTNDQEIGFGIGFKQRLGGRAPWIVQPERYHHHVVQRALCYFACWFHYVLRTLNEVR